MTLRAFCDIGGTGAKADAFAMWVAQFIGKEIRAGLLRGCRPAAGNASGVDAREGLHARQVRSSGCRTMARRMTRCLGAALYDVTVVPNQGKGAAKQRIETGRRKFPAMWFNEGTVGPGLEALGWYHEKKDEARGIGLGPEHDWSSHGGDSFGLMAICADRIFSETVGDWGRKIQYDARGIV
jgi:phage terminase large subunit